MSATTSLLQHDKSVLQEVGRGVKRLINSCPGASSPSAAIPDAYARSIVAQEQLLARQKSELRSRQQAVLAQIERAQQSQCRMAFVPLMRSSACQAANSLKSSLERLVQSSDEHFALAQGRYSLYRQVASAEAQSCVRAGFTQRILEANEEHMVGHDLRAQARFGDLLQSLSDEALGLK